MLIDTDAGVFYTKLRGAAQAPSSLVAEVIVGVLADALGLAVPARVLIDMPAEIAVDDPHWELAQLVRWSTGRNLGFQLLSNVRALNSPMWHASRQNSHRKSCGSTDSSRIQTAR